MRPRLFRWWLVPIRLCGALPRATFSLAVSSRGDRCRPMSRATFSLAAPGPNLAWNVTCDFFARGNRSQLGLGCPLRLFRSRPMLTTWYSMSLATFSQRDMYTQVYVSTPHERLFRSCMARRELCHPLRGATFSQHAIGHILARRGASRLFRSRHSSR